MKRAKYGVSIDGVVGKHFCWRTRKVRHRFWSHQKKILKIIKRNSQLWWFQQVLRLKCHQIPLQLLLNPILSHFFTFFFILIQTSPQFKLSFLEILFHLLFFIFIQLPAIYYYIVTNKTSISFKNYKISFNFSSHWKTKHPKMLKENNRKHRTQQICMRSTNNWTWCFESIKSIRSSKVNLTHLKTEIFYRWT